jgi:hypothetical protein
MGIYRPGELRLCKQLAPGACTILRSARRSAKPKFRSFDLNSVDHQWLAGHFWI